MKQAFIQLHLSILLAGFTGILGKLIVLNEGLLVWYRMLLTAVLILLILLIAKRPIKLTIKEILQIGGVGILLGMHWVFFYGSIKASNVSIGVVCFSTVGFFTAIFEPLIYRRKVSVKELCFSLLAVFGILLIFHFDTRYHTGIIMGIVSAALAALFTIANKRVVVKHSPSTMLFWEMLGGLGFLTLTLPLYLYYVPASHIAPTTSDIFYLALLCIFCTILMYRFQIQALKHISAFTVNLSYNLEPIYSIILAMVLFSEANELSPSFYIGLGLIILSVLLQTLSVTKQRTIN